MSLRSLSEQVQVINRRTEIFSPSKNRIIGPSLGSAFPALPFPPTHSSTLAFQPQGQPIQSRSVVPSFSPLLVTHSESLGTSGVDADGDVTMVDISYNAQPLVVHSGSGASHDCSVEAARSLVPALSHSTTSETRPSSSSLPVFNSLIPYVVKISEHRSYFVLPLAPGVRTAHDMVLPDASAFYDSSLKQDIYQYPPFTLESGAFTWQSMFKLVKRPVVLWNVYKPRNLGEYGTVKALWDVWDSGATIEGIGRCPPLRFIDESWGSRKDKNGTGKFPLWRPKNDTTARKTWSNFEFFIKKINERRDSSGGKSITEIIDEFEVLRGDDSNLNPLHKRLQVPRKKKDSLAPPQ
ncbi:hypothetical protein K435DRAFT_782772 [Dendrothele bispora CBS 962.96]|nr:hypothetical protein K435DRAFT_782772 [Dendrothele bispora CBS 962.96]